MYLQLYRPKTLAAICAGVASLNFIYLLHLEPVVQDEIVVVSSDRPPEQQQQQQQQKADHSNPSAAASLAAVAQHPKLVNIEASTLHNQEVHSALLPRCPVPNFDNLTQTIPEQSVVDKLLSNWDYYSKISYENSDMSLRVRNLTSEAPPITESNIPHRLIFTHFANLFDCSRSAAENTSPPLYNLAENAKHTVNLYAEIWDDVEYIFLTDDDCGSVVNEAMPGLVRYFNSPMMEGMYKADICRAAYLYLHGGYYFDVDVLGEVKSVNYSSIIDNDQDSNFFTSVVRPYVAAANTNLVTVKGDGWPENGFFQAFFAAEKGHPIVLKSLQLMLDYMNSNNKHYLGPMSLMESWAQIENVTNKTTAQSKSKSGVHLLSEANLMELANLLSYSKIMSYLASNFTAMTQRVPAYFGDRCQFSGGQCNFIVMDEQDETVYFYSRVLGTKWCGKKIRTNCTTAGMLAERMKKVTGGRV